MLVVLLLGAHALADYPLQGDFLAKAKNRSAPIPGVPWRVALASHAAIHALFVAVILGSWQLAVAEFVAHYIIDDVKCRGKVSFTVDQVLHLQCKAAWLIWALVV
jgi:hypothetical protein